MACIDLLDQSWNLVRRVLQISIERDEHVAAGPFKARQDRVVLTEVTGQ